MSVRAVAIRGTRSARLRVLPRTLSAPAAETTWRPRLSLMARLLDDHDEVRADLIGLYLQTKAMLNAYGGSRVELIARALNADAALAAAGSLEQATAPTGAADEDALDLPLWRWAEDAAAGASR